MEILFYYSTTNLKIYNNYQIIEDYIHSEIQCRGLKGNELRGLNVLTLVVIALNFLEDFWISQKLLKKGEKKGQVAPTSTKKCIG